VARSGHLPRNLPHCAERQRNEAGFAGGIAAGGATDWGWLYGTLVRNAGWTFAECDEQPAVAVFEFLDHLEDCPPDYVILANYYGTPKRRYSKRAPEKAPEEGRQVVQAMLGPSRKMPDKVRELLQWAGGLPN
jgi:hypothetical protein